MHHHGGKHENGAGGEIDHEARAADRRKMAQEIGQSHEVAAAGEKFSRSFLLMIANGSTAISWRFIALSLTGA